MPYPDTSFTEGVIDDEFGGRPANCYGVPMNSFRDAQIRELQRQAADQWWSLRPVQYLKLSTNGVAGDVVVFDANVAALGGGPTFRGLAFGGLTLDQAAIAGVLLEPASAGAVARVCPGGGVLAPSVTGLSGTSKGPITVDLTSGRLRAQLTGEFTLGYCDGNGNCYLLPMGFLP